jgi:hypothetical protein
MLKIKTYNSQSVNIGKLESIATPQTNILEPNFIHQVSTISHKRSQTINQTKQAEMRGRPEWIKLEEPKKSVPILTPMNESQVVSHNFDFRFSSDCRPFFNKQTFGRV